MKQRHLRVLTQGYRAHKCAKCNKDYLRKHMSKTIIDGHGHHSFWFTCDTCVFDSRKVQFNLGIK